jgi:GTP diphosphokinase / guanosine-3',5'-bis(diphosphate) 3'-diphosphatase
MNQDFLLADTLNTNPLSLDEETGNIDRAIALARQAHAQQVDKAGKPYIDHPLRVMAKMQTWQEKIVAVLHDAIEDSDLTLADLHHAGFPPEIVEAIAAITKNEGEDYETYLQRVLGNAIALKVKIADMTDNMDMSRIPHPTAKDWQRLAKYQQILPKLISHIFVTIDN